MDGSEKEEGREGGAEEESASSEFAAAATMNERQRRRRLRRRRIGIVDFVSLRATGLSAADADALALLRLGAERIKDFCLAVVAQSIAFRGGAGRRK